MHNFLASLQTAVKVNRAGPQHLDLTDDPNTLIEPMQQTALHSPMGHRKSVSTHTAHLPTANASFDPLGAIPAAYEGASTEGMQAEGASSPGLEHRQTRDDGFE